MKYFILSLCVLLAGCSTMPMKKECSCSNAITVPILLYHHVQDIPVDAHKALRRWAITPEQLNEHFAWIEKEGFSVISMAQLNDVLKYRQRLPANPLVLTFDDGWKEHYTIVFPLLQKYHYPATFFITTSSVGHSAFVDWDELTKMSQDEKIADIQAHSVTHPYLTRLKDSEVQREMRESKKDLDSHLREPVVVFAYPFGKYSEKTIDMARAAGYESAVIVSGSNIGYLYRADQTYTLRRIAIEGNMTINDIAQEIKDVQNANR